MPKETGDFAFTLRSNIGEIDGLTGTLRALAEIPATRENGNLTNWWSDDLAAEHSEGPHCGAKTVSRWRVDFLKDFAERFDRCLGPKK